MADGDCRAFVARKHCPFCDAELTTRFGPKEDEGGRRAFWYCAHDSAAWEIESLPLGISVAYERAMARQAMLRRARA